MQPCEDNPMQRRAFLRNAGMFALSACAGSLGGFATPAASPLRRFKLGVISDELSQDFEEALKTMKQFGLEWVEIRSVSGTYNTEASPAQLERIKDLLSKYPFRVSAVDTALHNCNLT